MLHSTTLPGGVNCVEMYNLLCTGQARSTITINWMGWTKIVRRTPQMHHLRQKKILDERRLFLDRVPRAEVVTIY